MFTAPIASERQTAVGYDRHQSRASHRVGVDRGSGCQSRTDGDQHRNAEQNKPAPIAPR
ncbi:hypothetical protein [Microbacterium sp.]|uniref:hypothetical protein n=1 Tax=Microbacterium sp. TaxID=51671 RepID=UPI002635069B|nr:hypothetical protein [Microbacterium sp.]